MRPFQKGWHATPDISLPRIEGASGILLNCLPASKKPKVAKFRSIEANVHCWGETQNFTNNSKRSHIATTNRWVKQHQIRHTVEASSTAAQNTALVTRISTRFNQQDHKATPYFRKKSILNGDLLRRMLISWFWDSGGLSNMSTKCLSLYAICS